jgi:molybdopterin/thiamine biosynthesis adenylyltransferase
MARFSDDEIRRYSRQMVLSEVGGVGQERLRATTATAVSEVEALYLAAAGVGSLVVPSAQVAQAVRALNPLVRVAIGSALAAGDDNVEVGALRAWRTLKQALQL